MIDSVAILDSIDHLFITLDEQHPEEALRLRIGKMMGTLAADEALTLLDWLGEREGTLFALTKRQPLVARITARRSSDDEAPDRLWSHLFSCRNPGRHGDSGKY